MDAWILGEIVAILDTQAKKSGNKEVQARNFVKEYVWDKQQKGDKADESEASGSGPQMQRKASQKEEEKKSSGAKGGKSESFKSNRTVNELQTTLTDMSIDIKDDDDTFTYEDKIKQYEIKIDYHQKMVDYFKESMAKLKNQNSKRNKNQK